MNTHTKRNLLFVLFIAVIVGLRLSPFGTILSFENLKQHRDALLVFVQDRYWLSVASFIATYIVATALSLPAGLVLTLAGGFLFGALAGVFYVMIGATTGATVAFLLARYVLGKRLQEKYRDALKKFNEEFERNGIHYLLTLRLIPVFPFFLINFLAGLTRVPLQTFVWTTAVGIMPATTVFAFAGRQLGTIAAASDLLTGKTALVFAALGFLAIAPAIYKKVIAKRATNH
jgi:uncharacterized membrane protein YdjX (TVP38/TMEM64 family)